MLRERIEGKWIDCFTEVFTLCGVRAGDAVAILSETQSRPINVELAELALHALRARAFHLVLPSPRLSAPAPGLDGRRQCAVEGSHSIVGGHVASRASDDDHHRELDLSPPPARA